MVHPRHREPLGAAAAPFFAEDLNVPAQKPEVVQWEDGCRTKRNDAGITVITWKGIVGGVPQGSAYVKQIGRRTAQHPNYRWHVLCPRLRFDGFALGKAEAFGMVERAAAALPCWLQRIREMRGEVVPTPEEERVLKVAELLVGARPLYRPFRGVRGWVLREDDIPEDRKADWARHGHTVCSMLRDLIR